MTKRELIDWLEACDAPDDAMVLVGGNTERMQRLDEPITRRVESIDVADETFKSIGRLDDPYDVHIDEEREDRLNFAPAFPRPAVVFVRPW